MPDSSSAFHLALSFPRVFVAGYPSFFEVRLLNNSTQPLFDVMLSINCPTLGLVDHLLKPGTLASGESKHLHVDVTPQMAGSQPIRCLLEGLQDRESLRYSGVCRDFHVHERPDSPSNISIIVQDIQSHRSGGDKGEFGSVKGDVNIHITDLLHGLKTVNDLLLVRLPEVLLPVRLDAVHSPDACDMLSIPELFLRYFEPAEVLHLMPVQELEGATPQGWRLCGGEAVVALGRGTQDADLVTRFLPITAENNAKSMLLSRKHALLRMSEAKGGLLGESLAAHATMRVGAQALRPGELTPVPSGEVLGIGPPLAEIRLRCTVRKPLLPRRFRVANLAAWIGNRITQAMTEESNWGRVEFDYLNSAPTPWHTLWFHRYISVGHGHGAVLDLGSPAHDRTTAYLHHLRGCFWIECTSEGEGRIFAEGQDLHDGDIVPLREGMKLTLGSIEVVVKRVR